MKMSGIKMLGLGTVAACGVGLSSCGPMSADICDDWANEARSQVIKSNTLTASGLDSIDKSVDPLMYADKAKVWVNKLHKMNMKNAIDSTRNATRKQIFDSLELAKKAVRHLK